MPSLGLSSAARSKCALMTNAFAIFCFVPSNSPTLDSVMPAHFCAAKLAGSSSTAARAASNEPYSNSFLRGSFLSRVSATSLCARA